MTARMARKVQVVVIASTTTRTTVAATATGERLVVAVAAGTSALMVSTLAEPAVGGPWQPRRHEDVDHPAPWPLLARGGGDDGLRPPRGALVRRCHEAGLLP